MKRGEIYYADLNPSIGDEIKHIRPVLIVSNNINNKMGNTVTVLPITKNVARVDVSTMQHVESALQLHLDLR